MGELGKLFNGPEGTLLGILIIILIILLVICIIPFMLTFIENRDNVRNPQKRNSTVNNGYKGGWSVTSDKRNRQQIFTGRSPVAQVSQDSHSIEINESTNEIVVENKSTFNNTTQGEQNVHLLREDSKPQPSSQKYEYLETANNGQFRKLLPTDEKSFFSTWNENGIRKFEFHGNVEKALANINAVFDDVCEIEGKQNGATQIINVEPGTLDSKLRVEKKAKIKLA